jgi:universal stress protein A
LRCFAGKNFQTVEKNVKSLAASLARAWKGCGVAIVLTWDVTGREQKRKCGDSRLRKKRTAFSNRSAVVSSQWEQDCAMKSQNIARNPVKLARRGAPEAFREGPRTLAIKRILAPMDFSPASEKALQYAIRFAQQFGAQLILLHVIEPAIFAMPARESTEPEFFETEIASANRSLCNLLESVRAVGVPEARSTIRAGAATNQIVEAARDLDIDLIVIATHGFTSWKHFTIGSTARTRGAGCPLPGVRGS